MIKKIKTLKEQSEQWLRGCCSRMTPERRLITVLILGVILTVVNIYITFRSIYEIGRADIRNEFIQINSIEPPAIALPNALLPESENNLIPENNDNN